jgi:hypothetical protein
MHGAVGMSWAPARRGPASRTDSCVRVQTPARSRPQHRENVHHVASGIGALFSAMVGFLETRVPLCDAILMLAFVGYRLMVVALLMLPETRGRSLSEIEGQTAVETPDARGYRRPAELR